MATLKGSSTEWLVPCDSENGTKSCPRRPNFRRTACKQLSIVLIVCWWFLGTVGVSYTYAQYRITRAKHLCGQLLYSKLHLMLFDGRDDINVALPFG